MPPPSRLAHTVVTLQQRTPVTGQAVTDPLVWRRRAESEVARGGEALLAASRERESLLSCSLHEMGSTMAAREEEWAGREEAFRRQVGL